MEYVVLAFFCGLSAGVIGKLKGSSFFIWFLVGAVLPLLGTIAAALLPRRAPRAAGALPGVREGAAAPRAGLHALRARS